MKGFRWAHAESVAAITSAEVSAIRSPMFRAFLQGHCWTSQIRPYSPAPRHCRLARHSRGFGTGTGGSEQSRLFGHQHRGRQAGSVVASNLPSPSAIHVSLGVQREIVRDLVISADFVVRQFSHIGTPPGHIDANHFSSVRGPVLPICSEAQSGDPKALCSLGPISLTSGIGSARYLGLLVRAEKRFSRGWQFLASYAYSSNVGDNFANGFDNDHPLVNYGPLDRDVRHILNLSGLVQLPKRFRLGFFVTYNSKPPFSAFLGGLDLNGDGTFDDLLPGTKVNQFNRGLGKSDLRRLVDEFNRTYAGKQDAQGGDIPPITLPSKFEFGDSFLTQDLRLSRDFALRERWRMTLIGEVFNLFNIGNLSGRSGDLLGAGFGRPTSRVTQVFGSGGPRAFQIAARVSF